MATRTEAYQSIYNRLRNPENSEKYNRVFNQKNENILGIRFHWNRMDTYMKFAKDCKDKTDHDNLERDFDVSYRHIVKLLDEQGWK